MQSSTKTATIIVGVIMLVAIVSSAIVPALNASRNQTNQTSPTDVPIPTFPPPIANLNNIAFDQTYLHPSGLFTVAQPAGWDQVQPLTNTDTARVTMTNTNALSVIEVSVVKPGAPVTNLDELDARYTTEYLRQSWSRYRDERETARKRDGDRLIIDFEMTLQQATYVARQVSWTDGDWIYEVRVVVPENAVDTLVYVLDNLIPTLHPNKQFASTPLDWAAYFDSQANDIIRYPSNWTLGDSAPGRLASITFENSIALRLQTEADTTVADEDAARAWVEANRSGATILSVQPVTRGEASGYSVAYSFTDIDGEGHSGLAVLLNGADNRVYSANLRFQGADVDLNAAEVAEQYATFKQVMDTFMVLPPMNLAVEATAEP